MAAVPLVMDFEVDPDLRFHVFIVANVDSLGLKDGLGFIWISDRKHDAEAIQERDALADDILADMSKQKHFDEVIEIETKRE